MLFSLTGDLIEAPMFEDIPMLHCARYAVRAAEVLSEAKYVPGDAWELGEKNIIIKDNVENLRKNLELLIPGESIVIFHNPLSSYNTNKRIGTHAALYLGRNGDLYFAEQYFSRQKAASLKSLRRRLLKPRQILAPKVNAFNININNQ
jgi:hypothetical protein